jgi:hypothetical protein
MGTIFTVQVLDVLRRYNPRDFAKFEMDECEYKGITVKFLRQDSFVVKLLTVYHTEFEVTVPLTERAIDDLSVDMETHMLATLGDLFEQVLPKNFRELTFEAGRGLTRIEIILP